MLPKQSEIFHSRESAFFISQFASGGKTNKGKEFMIAEGTV